MFNELRRCIRSERKDYRAMRESSCADLKEQHNKMKPHKSHSKTAYGFTPLNSLVIALVAIHVILFWSSIQIPFQAKILVVTFLLLVIPGSMMTFNLRHKPTIAITVLIILLFVLVPSAQWIFAWSVWWIGGFAP